MVIVTVKLQKNTYKYHKSSIWLLCCISSHPHPSDSFVWGTEWNTLFDWICPSMPFKCVPLMINVWLGMQRLQIL